jgi:hypothetical protein
LVHIDLNLCIFNLSLKDIKKVSFYNFFLLWSNNVEWLTLIALAQIGTELYTFINRSFILTIVVICPIAYNSLIFF